MVIFIGFKKEIFYIKTNLVNPTTLLYFKTAPDKLKTEIFFWPLFLPLFDKIWDRTAIKISQS